MVAGSESGDVSRQRQQPKQYWGLGTLTTVADPTTLSVERTGMESKSRTFLTIWNGMNEGGGERGLSPFNRSSDLFFFCLSSISSHPRRNGVAERGCSDAGSARARLSFTVICGWTLGMSCR